MEPFAMTEELLEAKLNSAMWSGKASAYEHCARFLEEEAAHAFISGRDELAKTFRDLVKRFMQFKTDCDGNSRIL